jgi:cob(I)alamin adenosyltransferase
MKVYTKRGDDGTTGLLYGGRVDKDDLRTTAYGTVDEVVSALGVARAELDGHLHDLVLEVQRELFALAAQLATHLDDHGRLQVGVSRVDMGMVDALDGRIDASVDRHPLPTSFVVPGGTRAAAALVADEAPLRYLNRLSDYLYVLAREAEGEHLPSREP